MAFLPPKLWRIIFRLATGNGDHICYGSEYPPFHFLGTENRDTYLEALLQTKQNIISVSKAWQHLGNEFMYEDIRLHPTGSVALMRTLQTYGHYVRRLQLPSQPTAVDPHQPIRLADILALCSGIQVIVKPPSVNLKLHDRQFWGTLAESPPGESCTLLSLVHIEWSDMDNAGDFPGDFGVDIMASSMPPSTRELFHKIIMRAPNLRHLSIGKLFTVGTELLSTTHAFVNSDNQGQYRFLTTLRLFVNATDTVLNAPLNSTDFPALTHLITNLHTLHLITHPSSPLCSLLTQLRILELDERTRIHPLSLPTILAQCPSLQDLTAKIFCPRLTISPTCETHPGAIAYPSLQRIRLYRRYYMGPMADAANMEMRLFQRQIDALIKAKVVSVLPNLGEIVLHGDWSWYLEQERFGALRIELLGRGVVLRCEADSALMESVNVVLLPS